MRRRVARNRRDSRAAARICGDARAALSADAEAEDLARTRAGAPRCRGGAVRRAADRHRSALKWLLRRKLKQIHQQLKLSLIYVTHDQTEALTFADQVVVMSAGRDRAGRHAGAAVRNAGASLRRSLHRHAGHELPRLRVARRARRRSAECASRRAARRRRRPALRWRSACGRSIVELAVDAGAEPRAGARRCGSGPGHPDDGATGNRRSRIAWAKLRNATRCLALRHRVRAPAACALRAVRGRTESAVSSAKPVNQRAWWFVLPVLISVAFSALIPLMTVVNYSVQDILGPDAGRVRRHGVVQGSAARSGAARRALPAADLLRRGARDRNSARHRTRAGDAASAAGARRSCWSCSRCRC